MIKKRKLRAALLLCGSTLCLSGITAVSAQESNADQDEPVSSRTLNTVTVTARKRAENLQDVPVVVSVVTGEFIENYSISGFEDVSMQTPALTIDDGGGAGQGAITLRGVTTGGLNTSSDQAVSINIDGVQISNGSALRLGQYDVEQIDVLKGPQALFFGKNSPGGIIALKTSDPTSELYVKARAGYEFEADQAFFEGTLSGPMTDTLGGRLFVRYSDSDGAFTNLGDNVRDPEIVGMEEVYVRGTLQWEPTDRFDANFKISYGDSEGDDAGVQQRFACDTSGLAGPLNGAVDNCTIDRDVVFAEPDASFATVSPLFRTDPISENTSLLSLLTANYEIVDGLTLTSVTSYFDIDHFNYGNPQPNDPVLLFGTSDQSVSSFAQEFRLTSDFDSRVNFMVDAFFDDREFATDQALIVPLGLTPVSPAGSMLLFENYQQIDSDSQSLAAQVIFDVTEELELAAGARYTEETRSLSGVGVTTVNGFPGASFGGGAIVFPDVFTPPATTTGPFITNPDEITYDNISPEVTVTWKPMPDVTLFGAYKQGFKSGGFNTSVTGNALQAIVSSDQTFNEELAEGVEFGVKSTPFPGVRLNAAVFSYEYSDLQLSTFDFSGGGVSTRVVNAAEAETQGLEIDASWQPEKIEGLGLTAAISYLDTSYTSDFFERCNGSQIGGDTAGCDFLTDATGSVEVAAGTGNTQNLNGFPLQRSPEWSGSFGMTYETSLTDNLDFRFGGNAVYSGEYETNNEYDPRGVQDAFWMWNASVGVSSADEKWSLDLIGRNLSDEIFLISSGSNVPFGGTVPGVSAGEVNAVASTTRAVVLQLTYKPFGD
ncbi:MAG: TonB-dependent receptor [Henriciella sp.]